MARILVSTPLLGDQLAPLAAHELIAGEPGSDGLAEALLCAPGQRVDAAAQERMSRLRVIGVAGAGTDAVDGAAATARGITILSAGEALIETTAELAFALMLAASRVLRDGDAALRAGRWEGLRFLESSPADAGEEPRVAFGHELHGKRLGLVGYGRIARAVAPRARAFAMDVIHHTRTDTGADGWTAALDDLLARSDVVSLHVPLTPSTRGLIDRRRLALMRREAVLVNTARGAVVDEEALAEALVDGHLFAAGLDVYAAEPRVHPRLLAAPRTVLLPHLGSATLRTREAMLRLAAERVAGFLAR